MGKDKHKQKDEWEDDGDAFFGGDPKNADRLIAKKRDKQKREISRHSKSLDDDTKPKV
jgi:hypothetical protein